MRCKVAEVRLLSRRRACKAVGLLVPGLALSFRAAGPETATAAPVPFSALATLSSTMSGASTANGQVVCSSSIGLDRPEPSGREVAGQHGAQVQGAAADSRLSRQKAEGGELLGPLAPDSGWADSTPRGSGTPVWGCCPVPKVIGGHMTARRSCGGTGKAHRGTAPAWWAINVPGLSPGDNMLGRLRRHLRQWRRPERRGRHSVGLQRALLPTRSSPGCICQRAGRAAPTLGRRDAQGRPVGLAQ